MNSTIQPTGDGPARPSPTSRRRQRLMLLAVGVTISLGFVWLLLHELDPGRVWAELATVNLPILSLAGAGFFVGYLVMSARTRVLLRGISPLGVGAIYRSVLMGVAGNNVLPFRLGEILRIDYLARRGEVSHSSCLAVIAVERLMDLFALSALALMIMPLALSQMPRAPAIVGAGAVVLCALAVLFALARHPEWLTERLARLEAARLAAGSCARLVRQMREQAERFLGGLAALGSLRQLFLTVVSTAGFWCSGLAVVRIMMRAYRLALPWYAPGVLAVFIAFGTAIPSSPGFIGTYHYFAALSLQVLGVDRACAVSFAIGAHAMGIVPVTIVSLLVLATDAVAESVLRSARPNR